ncbi:hypothetical protein OH407_24505, partial [Salmonella enterica]|uniref:hypothetical protein n=1 Tax=Salmonella enterica TaxID=28901 RepID=UPI0022B72511
AANLVALVKSFVAKATTDILQREASQVEGAEAKAKAVSALRAELECVVDGIAGDDAAGEGGDDDDEEEGDAEGEDEAAAAVATSA